MFAGDLKHPFYRPLWRRVAIVATTVFWFGFEALVAGSGLWTMLSGAVMAYCAYTFLIMWQDAPAPPQE